MFISKIYKKLILVRQLDYNWDTAGQERFKAITTSYYRNSIGALIVFDLTDRETFNNLKQWLDDLKEFGEDQMVKMIIGNKSDLEAQRQISKEEAIQFAKDNNTGYLETSSKTGENVNSSFEKLAEEIVAMLQDEDKTTTNGSFYTQAMQSDYYNKNDNVIYNASNNNPKINPDHNYNQDSYSLTSNSKTKQKKSGGCC